MPEKWIPPPPGSRWRDEGVADGGYLFPFHPIPLPLPPPDVARFKLPQHGKLLCPFGGERGWKRKIAKGGKRRKGGRKNRCRRLSLFPRPKTPSFSSYSAQAGGEEKQRTEERGGEDGETKWQKRRETAVCFPPPLGRYSGGMAEEEEDRREREPLKRGLISPSGEKEEDNKKKFRLFPPAELGKTNGEEKKEEG